jgi:hypothetical protein
MTCKSFFQSRSKKTAIFVALATSCLSLSVLAADLAVTGVCSVVTVEQHKDGSKTVETSDGLNALSKLSVRIFTTSNSSGSREQIVAQFLNPLRGAGFEVAAAVSDFTVEKCAASAQVKTYRGFDWPTLRTISSRLPEVRDASLNSAIANVIGQGLQNKSSGRRLDFFVMDESHNSASLSTLRDSAIIASVKLISCKIDQPSNRFFSFVARAKSVGSACEQ